MIIADANQDQDQINHETIPPQRATWFRCKIDSFRQWTILTTTRMAVSLVGLLFLIDVPRDSGLLAGQDPGWLYVTGLALGYLCLVVTPWHTLSGVLIGLPAMIIALIRGGMGVEPGVIVATIIAVAITKPRWALNTLTATYVAWSIAFGYKKQLIPAFWVGFSLVLVAFVIGSTIRHFLTERTAHRQRISQLETQNQREREALARDLHDTVSQELSVIHLQHPKLQDSQDPVELKTALKTASQASQTVSRELRDLIRVLRRPGDPDEPIVPLTPVTHPPLTYVADQAVATLHQAGFSPELRLDLPRTPLDPSLNATVGRIIKEASTNILRHASPGTPCSIQVSTHQNQIRVTVVSQIGPLLDNPVGNALSTGLGLHGISERIHLTGGHFQAGPVGDHWILDARLAHG